MKYNNFKEGVVMLKTISEALENFCIHQIRIEHTISNEIPDNKMIISYIDINTQSGISYRVYVASDKDFMQRISTIFLEEKISDEQTLIDMALETTNLIVGSAKVIAEESDINPYTIETPNFIKQDRFDLNFDDSILLKIENDKIFIAIKELI